MSAQPILKATAQPVRPALKTTAQSFHTALKATAQSSQHKSAPQCQIDPCALVVKNIPRDWKMGRYFRNLMYSDPSMGVWSCAYSKNTQRESNNTAFVNFYHPKYLQKSQTVLQEICPVLRFEMKQLNPGEQPRVPPDYKTMRWQAALDLKQCKRYEGVMNDVQAAANVPRFMAVMTEIRALGPNAIEIVKCKSRQTTESPFTGRHHISSQSLQDALSELSVSADDSENAAAWSPFNRNPLTLEAKCAGKDEPELAYWLPAGFQNGEGNDEDDEDGGVLLPYYEVETTNSSLDDTCLPVLFPGRMNPFSDFMDSRTTLTARC